MIIRQKRVAIYARVSRKDQSVNQQIHALKIYCKHRKMKVVGIFEDEGVSGTKTSRPQFDVMMDKARKRKFDIVLVFRFDRFARNMSHLTTSLDEFRIIGIDFISYTENFDTTTPFGKAMFQMVGVFAEFERDMISVATKERLDLLRKKGIPLGRPEVSFDIHKAFRLRTKGFGWRTIAKMLGGKVSYASIRRVLQKVKNAHDLQEIVGKRNKKKSKRSIHKKKGDSINE